MARKSKGRPPSDDPKPKRSRVRPGHPASDNGMTAADDLMAPPSDVGAAPASIGLGDLYNMQSDTAQSPYSLAAPPSDNGETVDFSRGTDMQPGADDGVMVHETDDGGALVDFDPQPEPDELATLPHDANLAEYIDEGELQSIADDLIQGIESDDQSRSKWLADRAKGMDLLGHQLEDPRSGTSSAPVDGMSVVRHPLLAEAVDRFKANASAELLPAAGPVKVTNSGIDGAQVGQQAEKLEKLLNYYLTKVDRGYYPGTRAMLFRVGFGGSGFKKVYRDPIKRRPLSVEVDAIDLIVSSNATDFHSAERVTQRVSMRKSVFKRMQLAGQYRQVDIEDAPAELNTVDRKMSMMVGIQPDNARVEDQEYHLYECYCELDLKNFEHKDQDHETGEMVPTGLPLPYRVTIDRTSKKIIEIRRNYKEGDAEFLRQIPFVRFPFDCSLSFYGTGLLHRLGNTTAAATAAWRMFLDAGMYANFPAFLYAKGPGRQVDNNFRMAPGEGRAIDTGNQPINAVVMDLPYKGPDPASVQFVDMVTQAAQRLGMTTEQQVGEGKQDAPVGTTLALIEQATKLMSEVHKQLHSAQAEEFEKLLDLFREDPEALWRANPKMVANFDVQSILQAMDNIALTPVSDPNIPSHMHRMAKAQALYQLASAAPQMFNMPVVANEILTSIGYDNVQEIMAPPQPAQPNTQQIAQAMEAQNKQKELALREQDMNYKYQDRERERQTKRDIEVLKVGSTLAIHPEASANVNAEITSLSPNIRQNGIPSPFPVPMPNAGPPAQPPIPFPGGMPMQKPPMPPNVAQMPLPIPQIRRQTPMPNGINGLR